MDLVFFRGLGHAGRAPQERSVGVHDASRSGTMLGAPESDAPHSTRPSRLEE